VFLASVGLKVCVCLSCRLQPWIQCKMYVYQNGGWQAELVRSLSPADAHTHTHTHTLYDFNYCFKQLKLSDFSDLSLSSPPTSLILVMRKMSHCAVQNMRKYTKQQRLHPPLSLSLKPAWILQNLLWYDVEWVMIFDCDLSVICVFYYFSHMLTPSNVSALMCVIQWKFMSCVHK